MLKISTVSIDEVEPFFFELDILEEVGRGAFSTTFKAIRDGQIVAVKVLDPLRANMERKEPEICALRKINSPYVVKLFDSGSFYRGKLQYPYLVCEYIEGIELEKLVSKSKIFSNDKLIDFCLGVGQGLDHMWQHKIIHRDLKPANIILENNREDCPKIIDFGFAKHLVDGPKDPKKFVGTPLYMAPEHIKQQGKVDIKVDLFALGVILYQLSSGVHPFDTEEGSKYVKKNVCTIVPPLPSSYNFNLNKDFEDIIMKLLRKKPERRFQNPQELLTALKKISGKGVKRDVRR